MAAINFPSSPSNGDTHTVGGVTYTYNSAETKWKTTINSNAFLPLSGGTVSGNIVLDGELQHSGDTDTKITFGTDTINLDTAGSTRATVDSSGRLLVGTTTAFSSVRNAYESEATPTRQTYVATATNSVNNGFGIYNFSSSGFAPNLDLCASKNNTVGSHTIVSSDQALGHINFGGSDGTQFRVGATILAAADGTPGASDMPGKLVFSTTADGASSPTERMRITSNGDLRFNSGFGSVATAYGVRAWIFMNGTGTISINGDGNVSTIGDNGTGDYTVNFSSNMPDTNYSTVGSCGANPGVAAMFVLMYDSTSSPFFSNPTTSSFRFSTRRDTGAPDDCPRICLAVFR